MLQWSLQSNKIAIGCSQLLGLARTLCTQKQDQYLLKYHDLAQNSRHITWNHYLLNDHSNTLNSGQCKRYLITLDPQTVPNTFISLRNRLVCSSCHDYTISNSEFLFQQIDGYAMTQLNEKSLVDYLGIKLGPALKICRHVQMLKEIWLNPDEY